MKENNFLRSIQYFFKKNAYALSLMACVTLAITMISLTVANYTQSVKNPVEVIDVFVPDIEDEAVPSSSENVIIFTLPIEDGKISKEYADDHLLEDKTTGYWQTHQALDFVASEGTKVLSVYDGKVESVEESMMDGVVITIDHGGNLKSVYKCLATNPPVSKGDNVVKGQEIGVVSTNLTEKADGIHLHYELYEDGKLIDPTPYFSELGK